MRTKARLYMLIFFIIALVITPPVLGLADLLWYYSGDYDDGSGVGGAGGCNNPHSTNFNLTKQVIAGRNLTFNFGLRANTASIGADDNFNITIVKSDGNGVPTGAPTIYGTLITTGDIFTNGVQGLNAQNISIEIDTTMTPGYYNLHFVCYDCGAGELLVFGVDQNSPYVDCPNYGFLLYTDVCNAFAPVDTNYGKDLDRTFAEIWVWEQYDAPVPTDNFSVSVANQNVFNITLNGTYYETTTGSITTLLYNNVSELLDLKIEANNYFIREYVNLNISTDLNTVIDQFPAIIAHNQWNGSGIQKFNVSIDNIVYGTETSIVYVPYNITKTVNLRSRDYTNFSHNVVLLQNNTFNLSLFMSTITINALEISTEMPIQNWTIHTDGGVFGTSTNTITINPNIGSYNWNFSNNLSYYNATGLSFAVDSATMNFTITNIFTRVLNFFDNLSQNTAVTPTCMQDGYTYNSYEYHLHKSSSNITCYLFGYENNIYEVNITDLPLNMTLYIDPVALNLRFSTNVSGLIETETEVSGFNASSIVFPQENVSIGFVTVTFNDDGTGKYQQVYKYYNDHNTTISDEILVQDVDLVQTVRITGNTQPVEGARVCAKMDYTEDNNDRWMTTYCDYTDNTGDVDILVNDQNTYLFCTQAEGFIPRCSLQFIPPANENTIVIDLSSTSSDSGTNYIYTNCNPSFNRDSTCGLQVTTYRPYYSICVNVTRYWDNGNDTTIACSSDSITESFLYQININYSNYIIGTYLNGVLEKNIYHVYSADNSSIRVDFDVGNNSGVGATILDRIEGNLYLFLALHIFLLIIGVLGGMVMEKYYNDYGAYGSTLWFLFLGIVGLPIFYIPAIIGVMDFINKRLLPLLSN